MKVQRLAARPRGKRAFSPADWVAGAVLVVFSTGACMSARDPLGAAATTLVTDSAAYVFACQGAPGFVGPCSFTVQATLTNRADRVLYLRRSCFKPQPIPEFDLVRADADTATVHWNFLNDCVLRGATTIAVKPGETLTTKHIFAFLPSSRYSGPPLRSPHFVGKFRMVYSAVSDETGSNLLPSADPRSNAFSVIAPDSISDASVPP